MRVLCSHDWLTGMRGGEKCLEIIADLFRVSDIYTLVHKKGSVSPLIESKSIHCSYLQGMPLAQKHYKYYLPFFPSAVESLKLKPCDLVISTSHSVAKGIQVPVGAKHICYTHEICLAFL